MLAEQRVPGWGGIYEEIEKAVTRRARVCSVVGWPRGWPDGSARRKATAHVSSCRCGRGHGRTAGRRRPGTISSAAARPGCRRSLRHRHLNGVHSDHRGGGHTDKDITSDGKRQEHRSRDGQMAPVGLVVAGPNGRCPLGADEAGPRQDEGTVMAIRTLHLSLEGGRMVEEAVRIMDLEHPLDTGKRRKDTSRCSMPPWWRQSLSMVTSGPLNTEGSFMSFQVKRSEVEPV